MAHLVGYLQRVGQGFRVFGKDLVHLSLRLEPFLFGVSHAAWVVQIPACVQANQTVMGFGVFFIHKMHVVGGYDFHTKLGR